MIIYRRNNSTEAEAAVEINVEVDFMPKRLCTTKKTQSKNVGLFL